MKKILEKELQLSSYRMLAWRLFAPLTVLEMFGFILDRALHLDHFFKIFFALTAIVLTIWGFFVTIRETKNKKA